MWIFRNRHSAGDQPRRSAKSVCLTNPSPGPQKLARQITSTCSPNSCARAHRRNQEQDWNWLYPFPVVTLSSEKVPEVRVCRRKKFVLRVVALFLATYFDKN